jgi:hypothetical protein
METKNRNLVQMMNVAGIIFCVVINYLAISLPLNGNDTRVLSDKYTNLFVPAPQTFSIWGVIYLGLFGFVIKSLLSYVRKDEAALEIVDRVGYWFFWSCLANGLWLISWHYEYLLLSVAIMASLWFFLYQIYINTHALRPLSLTTTIWVLLPFSIYLGWISVALIANISAYLVSIGWSGFGLEPQLWTKIMISIAAVLGVGMMIKWQDVAYALVIMWALYGIYVKHFGTALAPEQNVSKYALTSLIFLSIFTFLMLVGKKFYMFDSDRKNANIT